MKENIILLKKIHTHTQSAKSTNDNVWHNHKCLNREQLFKWLENTECKINKFHYVLAMIHVEHMLEPHHIGRMKKY